MSRCVKNPHASFSLKLFMADPSAHSVLLFKDISDKILVPLLPLAKSQSPHRLLPGQPPWCSPAGLVFCFQPHPLNGNRTMSSYKGTFRKNFVYLLFFLAVLDLCCCLGFSVAVADRGHSVAVVWGLLIVWLLLWISGSRVHGLQEFWLCL